MYSLQDRRDLADALLSIEDMRQRRVRDEVVREVERELCTTALSNARHDEHVAERDAAAIVTACARLPRGLRTLCLAVEVQLGRSAPEVKAFVALCTRLRPLALLSPGQDDALDQVIGGIPAPDDLEGLLRVAVGDGQLPGGPERRDLLAAVRHLRGLVNQEPLYRFVEATAATTGDRGSAARLRAWSDETAPLVGLTAEWLAGCRAALADHSPPERGYVVIRLRPDAVDADAFHVAAWSRVDGRDDPIAGESEDPYPYAALATGVGELVQDDLVPRGGRPPIVAFVLPCDRLNAPVDRWRVGPREFGLAYPVVVRAADRETAADADDRWRERAGRLPRCDTYDPDLIGWHDGDGTIDDGDWVCLALVCATMGTAEAPFRAMLASGAPAAVWHRDARSAPERRTALARVLTARPIATLPDTILHQRVGASHAEANADHAGRDVVLFWDDADHPSPDWYPLAAPEGPPEP